MKGHWSQKLQFLLRNYQKSMRGTKFIFGSLQLTSVWRPVGTQLFFTKQLVINGIPALYKDIATMLFKIFIFCLI